jgi:hypothetical protein
VVYFLRPGGLSSPRNLDDMLRSIHEADREARRKDREQREEHGVPLSDDEPWQDRAGGLLAALSDAVGASDLPAAKSLAARLTGSLVQPLDDPGDYEEDTQARTITFPIRALKAQAHVDALLAIRAKVEAKDWQGMGEAISGYVRDAVPYVDGFEDEDGPFRIGGDSLSDDDLEALSASGYLQSIFVCARDFQGLDGDEKKAFGRRVRTTTSTSGSALVALSTSGASGDATAGQTQPSGQALSMRMTPAPGAESSSTPGLTMPTTFTSLPTAGSSGQTASS